MIWRGGFRLPTFDLYTTPSLLSFFGRAISVDLGPRTRKGGGAVRGPCSYFHLGHLVLLYPWACFELTVRDDLRVMFRWTECFYGQRQRVGSVFAVVGTYLGPGGSRWDEGEGGGGL